jgi:hypothetical protein
VSNLIFISSPYSHPDDNIREQNYEKVSQIVAEYVSNGVIAISPITYGHTLIKFKNMPNDWQFWNNFCLSLLKRCDELWVLKMDGWNNSKGIAEEIEFAIKNNIRVKYIDI